MMHACDDVMIAYSDIALKGYACMCDVMMHARYDVMMHACVMM